MRFQCGKCDSIIEVQESGDYMVDALRRSTFNRMVNEHLATHPSERTPTAAPNPLRRLASN